MFSASRLSNMILSHEDFAILASSLRSQECHLRELHMESISDADDGDMMTEIFDALTDAHCQLEALRLTAMRFSYKSLANSLRSSTHLKKLHLENVNLENFRQHDDDDGDEDLDVVFSAIADEQCQLRSLGLERCVLTENNCKELASALSSNSHLKELTLVHVDLQDSRLKLVAKGLKTLETLRLPFCKVTAEGCAALVSALRANKCYLKQLELNFNHPGESAVKLLRDLHSEMHRELTLKYDEDLDEDIWMNPELLKKYAFPLTLDQNTAHKDLSLSEGNRKVSRVKEKNQYLDHPGRFDTWEQVFYQEELKGRHFWTVKKAVKKGVMIGVAYKTLSRKGRKRDSGLGLNDKSWSLRWSQSLSVWHNNEQTDIPVSESWLSQLERVAVFVDRPAGILSFYVIAFDKSKEGSERMSHLYTFQTKFTEPLFPVCRVTEGWVSVEPGRQDSCFIA